MLLKVGENMVLVSNSLDLGETPSYSASHLDLSCLHIWHLGCAWQAKGVNFLVSLNLHPKNL